MSRPYDPDRARLISRILDADPATVRRAYELLASVYRVQSLHDLTDEQLADLVAEIESGRP